MEQNEGLTKDVFVVFVVVVGGGYDFLCCSWWSLY